MGCLGGSTPILTFYTLFCFASIRPFVSSTEFWYEAAHTHHTCHGTRCNVREGYRSHLDHFIVCTTVMPWVYLDPSPSCFFGQLYPTPKNHWYILHSLSDNFTSYNFTSCSFTSFLNHTQLRYPRFENFTPSVTVSRVTDFDQLSTRTHPG